MSRFNLDDIRRTNPALAKRIEGAIAVRNETFRTDAQRRLQEALDAKDNHSGACDTEPECAELASLVGQVPREEVLDADAPRLRVTIERRSPRQLDDDNFAGGAKQLRDSIAELLGRKGDAEEDGLEFVYRQAKGKKMTIITIEDVNEK